MRDLEPVELLDLAFEGTTPHGFLRVPLQDEPPPLVLLLPGADSTKEELFEPGEHLLARGLAVAAFDGPGQGLVSFAMTLRPDYEVAVSAMLDALLGRGDLDGGRVAVAGISYGGLFACRAAATDSRVRAVAAISSWYSTSRRLAGFDRLPRAGVLHFMGPDAERVLDEMTLADVAERVRSRCCRSAARRTEHPRQLRPRRSPRLVAGSVTTVVDEDGVPVCNNIWYKARPLAADWLSETLQALPR